MSAWTLAHPWMTFCLIALGVTSTAQTIIVAINRIGRRFTMHKHGYPPPHCDSDGDFKEAK